MTKPVQRVMLGTFAFLTLLGIGVFVTRTSDFRPGASSRSEIGGPFVLTASDGTVVTDQTFRGHWMLVYFGYTHCPDICPTTLADLQAAVKHLGTDGRRVQVAMVTIDPRRDTPTVLRAYLTHFFPSGHPLQTDDAARLQAVADGFGARYDVTVAANGTEDVGHTAFVYAVDPEGRVVDTWPFGTDSSVVTHDLRILLRRVRGEASTSSREGSSS